MSENSNFTPFYTSLNLFCNINEVRVSFRTEKQTYIEKVCIPDLWRKGWVAQLSACKALQWLIGMTDTVRKPRMGKPCEAFEFSI